MATTAAPNTKKPASAPGTLGQARATSPEAVDAWTARAWAGPSERTEAGRRARKPLPRSSHAAFEPRPGRDPVAILARQEADRLQALVPLRHERMAASPFAYSRGTPAVMAYDLASMPNTEIMVQVSGDAHISNFGLFASPERRLVFDSNDFDETMRGPWEWDVKRLAASVVIAGRANGFSAAQSRLVTMATVRSYREWMARYAAMPLIEVWYSYITDDAIVAAGEVAFRTAKHTGKRRGIMNTIFSKARGRDQLRAASQLTTVV